MDKACENCLYYLPGQIDYKEDGICRFSPPTVSPTLDNAMGVWPRVKKNDWCGKYSPKKNQPPHLKKMDMS
ncbi:hypothetical protein [Maridesulfovibrio sp.]|jgi:hypothetical protein|uniref:hypothetical protein n=1 Tax=Maridesulfovibrio sp. TaxID=2795000 RepID=UPI0029C9BA42|nr:hypothetical protein [Maridesulfovibrio sp.]